MPKIRSDETPRREEREERDMPEEEEEDEFEERRPVGRPKIAKPEPKRRFGIIGPQPLRIVDTETNEVIGEGDFAVLQALTDILERLERIEVQMGAISS